MSICKFHDGKVEPLEEAAQAQPSGQDLSEKMSVSKLAIHDLKSMSEEESELLKNNPPATPLEAAIDKATGFAGDRGQQPGPQAAPNPTQGGETPSARDWVEEAYKCFIQDAGDIDPTDPVAAVEAYFQKNATDELKARCKAEGKDAKGCWRFIEAVARKALHGSSGHIDPGVVYAIAMHWFEDVPKDWDGKAAQARPSGQGKVVKPKKPTTKKGRLEERVSHGSSKAKAELRELKKKERAKAKPKAKRPKQSQGFFFEMLETPATTPEKESEVQG